MGIPTHLLITTSKVCPLGSLCTVMHGLWQAMFPGLNAEWHGNILGWLEDTVKHTDLFGVTTLGPQQFNARVFLMAPTLDGLGPLG